MTKEEKRAVENLLQAVEEQAARLLALEGKSLESFDLLGDNSADRKFAEGWFRFGYVSRGGATCAEELKNEVRWFKEKFPSEF